MGRLFSVVDLGSSDAAREKDVVFDVFGEQGLNDLPFAVDNVDAVGREDVLVRHALGDNNYALSVRVHHREWALSLCDDLENATARRHALLVDCDHKVHPHKNYTALRPG